MTGAKRHHQVPQFYLRGFVNDNDQVTVVRLGASPKSFTTAVKNVAVESNFYDVDWLGGERRGELEDFLGRAEGAAAESLRTVLSGYAPSPRDRYNLSAWIVLQYIRGRGGRADSIDLQKLLIRAQIAVRGREDFITRMRELGTDDTHQDWDRMIVAGEIPDPPTARLQHARTMLGLAAKIAPLYADAHWSLVQFRRQTLLTSDEPVCLWREPATDPGLGIGLATADLVSVPLSRDTLLSIAPQVQDGALSRKAPSTLLFKGAAANTWQHAGEILIHHPDDELPLWLPPRPATAGTLELPDIEQFIKIGDGLRSARTSQEDSTPQ